MHKTYVLILFLLPGPLLSKAQKAADCDKFLHSIDVGVFRYGRITESLNKVRFPQFFSGVYYNRFVNPYLNLSAGIEIGFGSIKDECTTCKDVFNGEGKLQEAMLAVEIKYYFFKNCYDVPFNFFVQEGIYYARSTYSGNFKHTKGADLELDNSYNKYGFFFRAGIDFFPLKRITIIPIATYKHGWIRTNKRLQGEKLKGIDRRKIPIELRISYNF
jgi:hypothetical protein